MSDTDLHVTVSVKNSAATRYVETTARVTSKAEAAALLRALASTLDEPKPAPWAHRGGIIPGGPSIVTVNARDAALRDTPSGGVQDDRWVVDEDGGIERSRNLSQPG